MGLKMNNPNSTQSNSHKLKIIDQITFNAISYQLKEKKKYKKSKQVFNLNEFMKLKRPQKKTRFVYAIYKTKNKSLNKSKPRVSKIKKNILRYRLLKTKNKNSHCYKGEEVTEELKNLSLQDENNKAKIVHSRRFREYCDNTTSYELKSYVRLLLKKLNHFETRAYKTNIYKGKSRRRIVTGFREVKQQMENVKIKCVIIATDCEMCDLEDGLDNLILNMRDHCKIMNIPCVFALERRKLSYVLHKKCSISCVGILNYDGAQDIFFEMLSLLEIEKSNYSHVFSSK